MFRKLFGGDRLKPISHRSYIVYLNTLIFTLRNDQGEYFGDLAREDFVSHLEHRVELTYLMLQDGGRHSPEDSVA